MKKMFIMGAMLLAAAAAYTADQVIDLSTPAVWMGKNVTAGKDAGTLSVNIGIQIIAKKMIPVDDKHTYNFSGIACFPEGKSSGSSYVGYLLYDKNKKFIGQINADFVKNSATELTEPAKKGSNVLKIKTNKQWKVYGHYRIGFNVQEGKLCTDLHNSAIKSIKAEGDTMTVTLKNKLAKDYAAGTKVRLQKTGSYFYTHIIPVKKAENKFGRALKQNQFWAETAYITPMILVNWAAAKNVDKKNMETIYKDLKLTVKEIK